MTKYIYESVTEDCALPTSGEATTRIRTGWSITMSTANPWTSIRSRRRTGRGRACWPVSGGKLTWSC